MRLNPNMRKKWKRNYSGLENKNKNSKEAVLLL